MTKFFTSLLLSFLLTCAYSVYSQVVEYNFGNAISKDISGDISGLFELQDSSLILISKHREKKNSFDLFRIDSSLNSLKKESYELDCEKITEFLIQRNEICAVGLQFDAAKSTDQLIIYIIDQEGNQNKKILFEEKSNGGYRNQFDVSISTNGDFISAIRSTPYVKGEKEHIHYKLFDENFKEILSKEISTSILSAKKRHNVISTTNDGFSYLLKNERIKGTSRYYIYSVSNNGVIDHADVRLKSRKIADMDYELKEDGKLVVGGFYSSNLNKNYIGFFMKEFDQGCSPKFSKEYDFNLNVFEAFLSKKDVKAFGYSLPKFHLRDLKQISDKNYILTCEHHSVKLGGKEGTADYRRGLIVVGLTNTGGFRLAAPILSNQTDPKNAGYWSSFSLVNVEGQPFVYLNKMGDGLKQVKQVKSEKSGFLIEQNRFNKSGHVVSTYNPIQSDLNNFSINTGFKNHTKRPIICLESLDHKNFTLGYINNNE